jgi:hypothetical protein
MWQAALSDENAHNRGEWASGCYLIKTTASSCHGTVKKAKLFTVKWLEDSITGKTDPIGDL